MSRFMNSSKSLAKKSFTSLHVLSHSGTALIGALVSGSKDTYEGDIYDNLRCTIGARRYDALCKDASSKLLSINYCRSALGTDSEARLLNHDFLLIEMLFKCGEVLTIRAEKRGFTKIGIIIDHVPDEEAMAIKRALLSTSFECGVQMGLEEVMIILVKPDPDYNLMEKNCWKYAYEVNEALLLACSRKVIPEKEKERLRQEAHDLRAKLSSSHLGKLLSRSSSSSLSSPSQSPNPHLKSK